MNVPTVERTPEGVHLAFTPDGTFTGYFGQVRDNTGTTIAHYNNTESGFLAVIIRPTHYGARHRKLTVWARVRRLVLPVRVARTPRGWESVQV